MPLHSLRIPPGQKQSRLAPLLDVTENAGHHEMFARTVGEKFATYDLDLKDLNRSG